jgi:hypothetical protein
LEILFIITNIVALLIGFLLNAVYLIKCIDAKILRRPLDTDALACHKGIAGIVRSCGLCGFGFQLLAWIMFSANQRGAFDLGRLTFGFAVAWAALCLMTVVFTAVGYALCGKSFTAVFKSKMKAFSLLSMLYFFVTFLIY